MCQICSVPDADELVFFFCRWLFFGDCLGTVLPRHWVSSLLQKDASLFKDETGLPAPQQQDSSRLKNGHVFFLISNRPYNSYYNSGRSGSELARYFSKHFKMSVKSNYLQFRFFYPACLIRPSVYVNGRDNDLYFSSNMRIQY